MDMKTESYNVKRLMFDDFNYELLVSSLRETINRLQKEKNTAALDNYRTMLADMEEEPWQKLEL